MSVERNKHGERPRNYHKALKKHLRRETGDRCGYCGVDLDEGYSAIDHIDADGPDDLQNYLICCRSCNSSKGRVSVEEFRERLAIRRVREQIPPCTKLSNPAIRWLVAQEWSPFEFDRHTFLFEELGLDKG